MTEHWDYQGEIAYNQDKANKVHLAETGRSRATRWCLYPGQHIHPPGHAGDYIWVVLEGKGKFLGAKQSLTMSGDDSRCTCRRRPWSENNGPEGLVFLSIPAG